MLSAACDIVVISLMLQLHQTLLNKRPQFDRSSLVNEGPCLYSLFGLLWDQKLNIWTWCLPGNYHSVYKREVASDERRVVTHHESLLRGLTHRFEQTHSRDISKGRGSWGDGNKCHCWGEPYHW